ncbi:MAG: GYF domain-containing protein [Planctomycetota bacterium]|jgi:hypothetical protein
MHPDAWHIVGDDGLEYGPVPIETIRRWIEEGRVVRSTSMRQGEGDWGPATTHPDLAREFGAAGAAEPPPPVSAPPPPPAGASGNRIQDRPATLTAARLPMEFEAWEFYKEAWRILRVEDIALLGIMMFLVTASFQIPVLDLAMLVLSGPILVGINRSVLGRIEGRPIAFGDMFEGFDRFLSGFGAYVVIALVTAIGFLLLIVPGVWMTIIWGFTFLVLAETQLGAFAAMGRSHDLCRGHMGGLFVLLLITFGLSILGALFFLVGLYVVLPVAMTANALAYRWLQRKGQQPLPQPATSEQESRPEPVEAEIVA